MTNRRRGVAVVLAGLLVLISQAAAAFDAAGFTALANQTIRQANMGVAGDIDELIRMQEAMIEMGVQGIEGYVANNPRHAKLLRAVAANAETMKRLSLDDIEAQWHQGEYLDSRGLGHEDLDHFGPVVSLMDAVIHPATAYICLTQYKETGDSTLLARASAELVEVVAHVAQLQSQQAPVMLTGGR